MLQIYGSAGSSGGRNYWLMEELGVAYEQMPLNMKEREHKSDAYLQLNPNGKVPTLVDDGFILWESAAINYYLADKYKPELLGSNPQERALVQQWSFWSLLHLQKPFMDAYIEKFYRGGDEVLIAKAIEETKPVLEILEKALEGQSYLVVDTFTLADVSVGSVLALASAVGVGLAEYPHVDAYVGRLQARPALQKVMAMMG